MRKTITSAIKKIPRLYDLLNELRTTDGALEAWLSSLSSQGRISFIQVGASDGLRWDPLRKHIIKNRWHGTLIEPLPGVYELLKKNYKYLADRQSLAFENAALSKEPGGNLTFWACSKDFLRSLDIDEALFWLRKSSLQKKALERELRIAKYPDPESVMEPLQVPITTLGHIINDHLGGHPPDLLFIDAEGHDDEVIFGHDFTSGKPRWIVYESHGLEVERRDALSSFLAGEGYILEKLEGDTVATLMAD